MRTILLSLFVIAVVASIAAVGVSGAWFSDTRSTAEAPGTPGANKVVTGAIELDPIQPMGIIWDLKPCQPQFGYLWVHVNAESNPGDGYLRVVDVGCVDVKVTHAEEMAGDPNGDICDIQNWMTTDLRIGWDKNGDGDVKDWEMETIIDPADHIKLGHLEDAWIPLGGLEPCTWYLVEFSFHLQAETPNTYQADECDFDVEVTVSQTGTPGPTSSKILLENKDPNTWEPILGDGKWGVATYDVGSLDLTVYAQGLPASSDFQVSLTSPEVASWYPVSAATRVALASALASDSYSSTPGTAPPAGFNLYERGYCAPGATVLNASYTDGDVGVFNVATGLGVSSSPAQTDALGVMNWSGSCNLPSGTYSFIKILVKDDASPYATHLMEKTQPLFFTIP